MKDLNDLISNAKELHEKGLRSGEIADELNISRDTATWLLTRSETSRGPVPKDIYVNWSEIGQNAERLRFISLALADMILETGNPDVVVGVALSGLPLATLVAEVFLNDTISVHERTAAHRPHADVQRCRHSCSVYENERLQRLMADGVAHHGDSDSCNQLVYRALRGRDDSTL